MVMLPKSILEELGRTVYPRKTVEYSEIKKRFAMHGYGPNKIQKWYDYFIACEILTVNEDMTISCIFW